MTENVLNQVGNAQQLVELSPGEERPITVSGSYFTAVRASAPFYVSFNGGPFNRIEPGQTLRTENGGLFTQVTLRHRETAGTDWLYFETGSGNLDDYRAALRSLVSQVAGDVRALTIPDGASTTFIGDAAGANKVTTLVSAVNNKQGYRINWAQGFLNENAANGVVSFGFNTSLPSAGVFNHAGVRLGLLSAIVASYPTRRYFEVRDVLVPAGNAIFFSEGALTNACRIYVNYTEMI